MDIPIIIGRSSGESPWFGDRLSRGDAEGLCPLFLFNQFQLPTEAEFGSPSSALKAAESTNFPLTLELAPEDWRPKVVMSVIKLMPALAFWAFCLFLDFKR